MTKVLHKLVWSAAIIECVAVAATAAYLVRRGQPPEAPSQCQASPTRQSVTAEPIVATARGDRYYHRRSCRDLSSSKRFRPLSHAQQRHRPCARCKPPR
jgi:hypothetical protein